MTALNNSELRDLLNKEAQGRLTSDEKHKLDDWYNAFDKTQSDLQVFRDTSHEEQVRQRLLTRIIASEFPETRTQKPKNNYRTLIQWSSVAAIFLMLIGGAVLWKHDFRPGSSNEILLTSRAGLGMLQKIKLEDGTEIWLNAGSKLRYPQHFLTQRREVYLEGEAYFDVMHDPSRPFIVHTDRLTTNVLGTAFSVTAYKNVSREAVTVIRGKVQVAEGHKVLGFLTPNKRIEYNLSDGKSYLSEVSAASMMSWKDGKLQFENQNMQDIAARLGRWYGYSFRFEHNQIKNCRYTASFDNKIPLDNLLRVMKAISLVNYKVDNTSKTVTFLGTGCNE